MIRTQRAKCYKWRPPNLHNLSENTFIHDNEGGGEIYISWTKGGKEGGGSAVPLLLLLYVAVTSVWGSERERERDQKLTSRRKQKHWTAEERGVGLSLTEILLCSNDPSTDKNHQEVTQLFGGSWRGEERAALGAYSWSWRACPQALSSSHRRRQR